MAVKRPLGGEGGVLGCCRSIGGDWKVEGLDIWQPVRERITTLCDEGNVVQGTAAGVGLVS